MKRILVGSVVAVLVMTAMLSGAQAANSDPGGVKGLLTGCCFGLRTGADYNDIGTGKRDFVSWFFVGCCCGVRAQEEYRDGKEITFRDWGHIIPYVGIIFPIWDGINTMNGITRAQLQKDYGSQYY